MNYLPPFAQLLSFVYRYASFDYEDNGYEPSDIVKLSVGLNGDEVDALSTLVHSSRAYEKGKFLVSRLKEVIRRQLYDVAIQASAKGKVISRETVKAVRKDVTAKCYGGQHSCFVSCFLHNLHSAPCHVHTLPSTLHTLPCLHIALCPSQFALFTLFSLRLAI